MEKDYSNRTIAYLVLVALFVSIAGTLLSLSRIGGGGIPLITGGATSGTGTTILTIESTLSITTSPDTSVDFGTCRPQSAPGTWWESNDTSKGGSSIGQCTGLQTSPDNITVENDGSADANVTINTSTTDLTGGDPTNRSLWFSVRNASGRPGCQEGIQIPWFNMTTNVKHNTCANLTPGNSVDRMYVFFAVFAPSDSSPASRTATITFTAHSS